MFTNSKNKSIPKRIELKTHLKLYYARDRFSGMGKPTVVKKPRFIQLSLELFLEHGKMFLNFTWKNEQVRMFQKCLKSGVKQYCQKN